MATRPGAAGQIPTSPSCLRQKLRRVLPDRPCYYFDTGEFKVSGKLCSCNRISPQALKNPHVLSLRTLVNGEQRQSSNTKELQFNIPEIIEFLSQSSTLHAGSIVLTGTPGGVGFAMKPQVWLKDGDEVQVRFGKVGTLFNRFVNES